MGKLRKAQLLKISKIEKLVLPESATTEPPTSSIRSRLCTTRFSVYY